MADLKSVLDTAKIPDLAKADAWDAFQEATTPEEFRARFDKLAIPESVKADLWDLKFSASTPDVTVKLDYGTGAPDDRTATEVMQDQAAAVLGGIPKAITGIPGTIKGLAGIAYDQLTGNAAGASEKAIAMAKGAVQPLTTSVRGAAAYIAPNRVDAPSRQEWEQAAEGSGATLAGAELGNAASGAGALASRFGMKPQITVPPVVRTLDNPVLNDAVAFGERNGIPVDAATATGNKMVASLQQAAEHSPFGSVISQLRRRAQARALTETGQRLANDAHPTPVTAEQAGAEVQGTIKGRISALKQFEDKAYTKFREAANDPANVKEVQIGTQSETMKSHFDGLANQAAQEEMNAWAQSARNTREFQINAKQGAARGQNDSTLVNAAGKEIDEAAASNARRIQSSGTKEGSALAGFKEGPAELATAIEKGSGKLFTRIQEAFRDSITETYGDDIRMALKEQGVVDNTGVGVAQVPILKKMSLPVDMRAIKANLKPSLQQMEQWMEPAKRNASAGFTAIKSIVNGPDYLPATIAEQGLGGLKSLAREATSADLRDVNSGLGANAAKQLQAAIDRTVGAAGQDALDALQAGRMAHAAKMQTADVLQGLRDEPVQLFDQATWAKDAGINRLREVAKLAPRDMPKIGRAFIDQLLEKATAEGGFEKTQGLLSKWHNLGPETKRILFPDPALRSNLDNFFLLAKKMAERPNPSGSGVVLGMLNGLRFAVRHPLTGVPMMIAGAPLTEMLYSPKGVRLLTQGMKVRIQDPGAAVLATQILALAGKTQDVSAGEASRGGRIARPALPPAPQ